MKLIELTKYNFKDIFASEYSVGAKFYVSPKAIQMVQALSDVGFQEKKELPGSEVHIWLSSDESKRFEVMESPEEIAKRVRNADQKGGSIEDLQALKRGTNKADSGGLGDLF